MCQAMELSLDYERHRDFKAPKLYIYMQEIMYFRVTQNEPQHRHKHVLRKQNPVSLCTLLHMQLQNSICTIHASFLQQTTWLVTSFLYIHRTPGTRACYWFPLGLPESTGIFYGTFSLYGGLLFYIYGRQANGKIAIYIASYVWIIYFPRWKTGAAWAPNSIHGQQN